MSCVWVAHGGLWWAAIRPYRELAMGGRETKTRYHTPVYGSSPRAYRASSWGGTLLASESVTLEGGVRRGYLSQVPGEAGVMWDVGCWGPLCQGTWRPRGGRHRGGLAPVPSRGVAR